MLFHRPLALGRTTGKPRSSLQKSLIFSVQTRCCSICIYQSCGVSYPVHKCCFAFSLWKSGFLIFILTACPENSCVMCCQMLYFAFMVLHMENKLLLLGSSDAGSDGMSMGFFWLPLHQKHPFLV